MTFPFTASAQTNYYTANGTEYPVIGSLAGDQMFPDAALSANGGFVVWQDNATDGDGWGISARRVDSTLSGTLSTFRVNAQGSNDQENARVTLLKNGGAAFVWEGGKQGYQHIFARYLTPANTWLTTTDLVVSTFNNNFQANPVITTLNNSNVVIVWSSFNQAGSNSLLDVYAKIMSPVGATVKSEFLVNQFTSFNQRSPVVAALKSGGFVVAWVSEQQRVTTIDNNIDETNGTVQTQISLPSVDIYARLFQSNGGAVGNEFIVNTNNYPCANPTVASASDGTCLVAWSARDMAVRANGWDVYARSIATNGVGDRVTLINAHVVGNQYAPRLNAIGLNYLVVWTSLSQDGSREGVYGRTLYQDGTPTSGEFRVNTTTASQQMQPVVVSDGVSQFLAIWTSFTGIQNSFDLYAQRYVNMDAVLQAMPAPFVNAPFSLSNGVYQPQLEVSWAPLTGISVTNYEIYVDGAASPMAVTTSNIWLMTAANGLTAGSTHSFQVDYVKTDGARSPLSPATNKSTWGGLSWGGVPYEWMALYYGGDVSLWPSSASGTPSAAGAPDLLKVFLSGGNPLDSTTWLTTHLDKTLQGVFLSWNTQPGFTYQVQFTTDFKNWSNLGSPRFAAGTSDSVNVGGGAVGYYQVVLLR
ncbi:MAG TPA: hypothetical protein VGO57_01985 [Verrucomicrobiae bacterium]